MWHSLDMNGTRAALCLVLLTVACGSDSEPPPEGPLTYQALHYDYAFDLETRAAATAITLRVTAPGNCLSIPMRAIDLADVQLDDVPIISGEFVGNVLTVCGGGWDVDEEFVMRTTQTIPLATWGDSQVGYSVSTDREDNPFYYLVSWVGGCDQFGPCDSRPDHFARYRFTVSHPSGMQVMCPGVITPGDTETTCEFEYEGGPTYSTFGVAASPSWVSSDLGTWSGAAVTLHDVPATGIANALDTESLSGFFAWMIDQFGPYPYGDELRFITAPTYWGGFEHPGSIVLSDQLNFAPSQTRNRLTHTSLHELTHQWAGDQTTLAGVYDFVWKEAMAEYLSFVYEHEHIYAPMGLATARRWKAGARGALYYPVPGEEPPLLDYYGDVYSPGPMILFRQIEALFDRAAVLTALRSLLGQPRAIGVDDVQRALESATGANLSGYFAAWVHGAGQPAWPEFTVTVTDVGGGAVDVRVDQVDAARGTFGCAFAVVLTGDAGESHEVWFDLGPDGAASMTITATPGFAVTGHSFDPDAYTLATERMPGATTMRPGRVNPWLAPRPPARWQP